MWVITRSSGEKEVNWHIARNWRVLCEMGYFQKLRGEPWWRIPMTNLKSVRLTLLHELKEQNPQYFPDDVWEMLKEVLKPGELNDEFLKHYPSHVFDLEHPSDEFLLDQRLDL